MHIKEPYRWLQPALASYVSENGTQQVCEFVDAATKTVRRWESDENPAKGGNEIRLWHFLLAAGYGFPDLAIDAFNFYIAQLYSYSIVSLEKATELCGVRNTQTTLQIMRGQPPMHSKVSLDELKSTYEDALQDAKRDLQQKLRVFDANTLPQLPKASAEELAEAPAFDVLVPVLAAMVKGVLPLATLAVESWTPAQRSRLREQVGDELFDLANNVYVLSQFLSALNSERARTQHFEGK